MSGIAFVEIRMRLKLLFVVIHLEAVGRLHIDGMSVELVTALKR